LAVKAYLLVLVSLAFLAGLCELRAEDLPPLGGPITKCDAKLQYLSEVTPTGKQPPYQLAHRLSNADAKPITDIDWGKPDLSIPTLAVGSSVEDSYPVSDYTRDKDAPIKIWYQGCSAPAEAYLLAKDDKAEKRSGISLRSLLRHFAQGVPVPSESAEVMVSLQGASLQFDIRRQPANLWSG
jgi:hypothetical protein